MLSSFGSELDSLASYACACSGQLNANLEDAEAGRSCWQSSRLPMHSDSMQLATPAHTINASSPLPDQLREVTSMQEASAALRIACKQYTVIRQHHVDAQAKRGPAQAKLATDLVQSPAAELPALTQANAASVGSIGVRSRPKRRAASQAESSIATHTLKPSRAGLSGLCCLCF